MDRTVFAQPDRSAVDIFHCDLIRCAGCESPHRGLLAAKHTVPCPGQVPQSGLHLRVCSPYEGRVVPFQKERPATGITGGYFRFLACYLEFTITANNAGADSDY